MTNVIYENFALLPLPPAPSQINRGSVLSITSTDLTAIFISDGALGCIFDFKTISWGEVFSFPYTMQQPTLTGCCFMRRNNQFVLVLSGHNIFSMTLNGIIKTQGNFYFQSLWSTFSNATEGFPWAFSYNAGNVFYMTEYPDAFFVIYQDFAFVGGICVAYDFDTFLPKFQFRDPYGVLQQGGQIVYNTLCPGCGAYAFSYTFGEFTGPYVSVTRSDDIVYAIKAGLLEANYATSVSYGSVSGVGGSFNCPGFSIEAVPIYPAAGFVYSLTTLPGKIIGNLFIQNNGDGTITYIPISILTKDMSVGEFGLPLTFVPPFMPNFSYGNGDVLLLVPTVITNGNMYGEFKSDFSQGFYLGLGIAGYGVYNLINYTRRNR